ncbi:MULTISPECIES: tripartite tricarboxylate transporter substrate-binding protein [unclassified Beijerinckia]|uniref:Bug family tripartite tricarboxylate transporter substrate binding protein n=1 Tax=unclassified Beijerinckia TaxID=2638183 RepID=UPI00089D3FAE|nr:MULTISPECIES: tripartite tricarboxylate transporter substrate-binding protein [unclassified Beijerinckia]MDH7798914.1 tripartite-type tricarboxylate transporter receptor subunit TctC [Beijerinckia sp. GAS462]SED87138.1 Tripartite-type tricarboxylate transporter, receptor component TctC [Beijerinckia sp. 28-YEA-48]
MCLSLRHTALAAAFLLHIIASPANAQQQTVRLFVGLPAGGSVDVLARLLADKLQASLGKSVIVENRPGASARIAVQAVKSSPPDGSALLVTPGAIVHLYPHVFKNLGYDPFKDLTPISKLVTWDFGFAVPANSSIKTVRDFIDAAKANPKAAFYGSPSSGSPQHLLGVQMASVLGVPLQHVWFKGAADAVNALLSDAVPSAVLALGDLSQQHKAGTLRVLATFSKERSILMPDVPTMTELGYPELQATGGVAFYGPGGMSRELSESLSRAAQAALDDPIVKDRIQKMDIIPVSSTSRELQEYDLRELDRWHDSAKASGFFAD